MTRIGLLTGIGRTIDAFFPEIMERWRQHGHEVFPAAGEPGRFDLDLIEGVSRNPHPSNTRALGPLRQWAERRRLDVVITNTATASTLARVARLPCPVIYFCHGLHWSAAAPKARDVLWKGVERSLIPRTDGVVTLNGEDHAWFEDRFPDTDRLVRLEFGVGVDTDRFARSTPPSLADGLRLLWIGEFSARKRPMDAVAVARTLADSGMDFRLSMAGLGPLRQNVERAIEREGLTGVIRCPGHVDIPNYLAKAHALVHTASWEGLPRVVLEALSVGRPTFGYAVKGVRDLPTMLSPYGDTDALARQIERHEWTDDLTGYPAVEDLSSAAAADRLLEVVDMVLSSGDRRGRDV